MEIIKKMSSKFSLIFSHISRFFRDILDKIPLFEIDSVQTVLWNIILVFVFAFHIFDVPLDLSFDLSDVSFHRNMKFCSHDLPLITGIMDMFYSLNTAYYSKGVFVKERNKIFRFYFKKNFWLDLVAFGPFFVSIYELLENHFIYELNFIFVAIKMTIIIIKLEDYFQFKNKTQGIVNLLKLLFFVLYIAHLSGCAWHYIAKYEMNELNMQMTWLKYAKAEKEDWVGQYVNALYFSIVTMCTVGYGDISPQNSLEKSFSIVMISLTCGIYCYALNSIGIIFNEMYREDNEFK